MGKNCLYCERRIEEKVSFCPFCGKKQLVDETLVNAARQNDQQAITEIYMLSQQNVYFTIRSMVKSEDIIADLVQDTFIKVFESLDALQFEQEKFQAWVRRIAHNTTINYLRKKKEVLFSEMEGEDSETEIDLADERTEYLPEEVIDRDETSRLVCEMLNSLSDEQRLAVGMYYYEQYSVNEIAETMGVSANTVKSRLNYARKKIEEQVRELEKKGISLFGLSPIPFLLLLFKNQDMQAEAPDISVAEKAAGVIVVAKTAAEAIAESAAVESGTAAGESVAAGEASVAAGESVADGEASATAGESVVTLGKASAVAGKGIAAKVAVGVLVVGLVGGTVFYAAHCKPEEEIPTETAIALETETVFETETEVTETEIEIETETETMTETEIETETEVETETETETETESELETTIEEFVYTFTSMDKKAFVEVFSSDIMDTPDYTDGTQIGSLSVGDVVEITGQCNEVDWYRINYNGGVGYIFKYNILDADTPDECSHSWYEFYNDIDSSGLTSTVSNSDGDVLVIDTVDADVYYYICEECDAECTDTDCDHEWIMGYTGDSTYEGSCDGITYTIYENVFYYVCEKCGAYWFY